MDRKIFDERLKSISEYRSEIQKLVENMRTIESAINEVTQSFLEFFPFVDGDILLEGSTIFKVAISQEFPIKAIQHKDSIAFNVWLLEPDRRSYNQIWIKVTESPTTITIEDIVDYKVIANIRSK